MLNPYYSHSIKSSMLIVHKLMYITMRLLVLSIAWYKDLMVQSLHMVKPPQEKHIQCKAKSQKVSTKNQV